MADSGSTSVRLQKSDKRLLARLQKEWEAVRGQRPSQQELLTRTLEYASRHAPDFLTESAWTPLTSAQLAAWNDRARDLGKWQSTDIDETLYG